ncbi:MAG: histidine phosphatase family protein, partial [Alistipes sp.]|nr:histidine phosphatase family protein [Alistipes sp.]
ARIMRGNRPVEIVTDDRLMEISFGVDEGRNKDELGEHFSNFFFAPEKYVPSEGGETYEDVCARAADFFKEKIEPLRESEKTVLIVAHGTMNKALMLYMKNIAICDIWKGEFQKNCCVNCYGFTKDTFTVIEEAKIYYEGAATDFLEK